MLFDFDFDFVIDNRIDKIRLGIFQKVIILPNFTHFCVTDCYNFLQKFPSKI